MFKINIIDIDEQISSRYVAVELKLSKLVENRRHCPWFLTLPEDTRHSIANVNELQNHVCR